MFSFFTVLHSCNKYFPTLFRRKKGNEKLLLFSSSPVNCQTSLNLTVDSTNIPPLFFKAPTPTPFSSFECLEILMKFVQKGWGRERGPHPFFPRKFLLKS